MSKGLAFSMGTFTVFGVNHKTAPLNIREKFYMSHDEIKLFYNYVSPQLTKDLFVVSTCNRTEFYGFVDDVEWLIYKYLKFKSLIYEDFEAHSFIYRSHQAINYAYRVACGLESKILGDYQVLGQFKDSVKLTSESLVFSAPLERLLQSVFQSCKKIKNTTEFNDGSASVPYTTSQYVKTFLENNTVNNVLIVGFGEMGKNTFKYLVEEGNISITLINRSIKKIQQFGSEKNVRVSGFTELRSVLKDVNVVIVATNSSDYIINHLDIDILNKKSLLIDLSVPRNIDPKLDSLLENGVVTIDTLEAEQKEVIEKRKTCIESVENIIFDFLDDYKLWLEYAEFSPLINTLKSNLKELRQMELSKLKEKSGSLTMNDVEMLTERMNNKILVQFIQFLKNNSSEKDIQQKLKELIGF